MNKYDYVINKPSIEDVFIEHGWLKDQAAKVHKYIKRWRNKAGKWVYQYKKSDGRSTHLDLDERENDKGYPSSRSQADIKYGSRNSKYGWSYWAPVKGLSDHGNSNSYSKNGINRGIAAGRKRAKKRIFSAKVGAKNSKQRKAMTNAIKNKRVMGSSNRTDKPYYRTEEFDFGNGIRVKKRGVVRTTKKKK